MDIANPQPARGADLADSDIDLLVVGDLGLRDVSISMVPRLRDLGREPNIVVLSESELASRAKAGDHFVTTVLSEPKIWLVGDDDQLAAVVG